MKSSYDDDNLTFTRNKNTTNTDGQQQFQSDQLNCFVYKLEYPYMNTEELVESQHLRKYLGLHCSAEIDFRNKDSTTFDDNQRLVKSFQLKRIE